MKLSSSKIKKFLMFQEELLGPSWKNKKQKQKQKQKNKKAKKTKAESPLKSCYIFLYFGKWNSLALIIIILIYFLKRKLFFYFRKQKPWESFLLYFRKLHILREVTFRAEKINIYLYIYISKRELAKPENKTKIYSLELLTYCYIHYSVAIPLSVIGLLITHPIIDI